MSCDDWKGWDGGREAQEGRDGYVHIADSPTAETKTTLWSSYTPIFKNNLKIKVSVGKKLNIELKSVGFIVYRLIK